MSNFADDLVVSGSTLRDNEFVVYLLAILNEEYNHIFTAIVARTYPISPGELHAQLLSFEQHTALQKITDPRGSSSALAASRGHGSSGGCSFGSSDRITGRGRGRSRSSRGVFSRGGFSRSSGGNSSRPQCQVCLKIGHTADKCWHRFKEYYVPEPHTSSATSSSGVNNSWYTDSGATDHITGDMDRLTMLDRYASADQVHGANGIGMDITHIGKTVISNLCRDLVLNNILHVPSINKNLISFIVLPWTMITSLNFTHISFLLRTKK
jgi:hypothetical protein